MTRRHPNLLKYKNLQFNRLYVASPPDSSHFDEYLAILSANVLECKAPRTCSVYLNLHIIQTYAIKNNTENILVLLQVDQWNQAITDFLNNTLPNLFVFAIPLPSLGKPEVNIFTKKSIIQYVPSNTSKSELKFKQGAHLTRVLNDWIVFSKSSAKPFPDHKESSIEQVNGRSCEPKLISIHNSNAQYDFYFNPCPGSNRLAVFHQSAISRSAVNIPIFHRWKWSQDISAHAIVLNDPTLFLSSSLNCGWWLGEHNNRSFLTEFNGILKTLMIQLDIDENNLFIYGASAGGFSALKMGLDFPRSTIVVDIPQTNLLAYQQRKEVDNIIKVVYGIGSTRSSPEVASKLNLCMAYEEHQSVPNIVYLQNDLDSHHVEQQMIPFMNSLAKSESRAKFFFGTYTLRHPVRGGHTPLPRQCTINLLDCVMNGGVEGISQIHENLCLIEVAML